MQQPSIFLLFKTYFYTLNGATHSRFSMHKILFFFILFYSSNVFSQASSFQIGLAKTEITNYSEGAGMLGYGMAFNVAKGIQTPLYARSFVLQDNKQHKLALVECELCFIPSELKSGIISLLQKDTATRVFTEENVIIMAQHTHSAPGGYCHYASYNMSVPGFIPALYDSLCAQIARSLYTANQTLNPCSIKLSKGSFPEDWEVAFNRSIASYNMNKDVEKVLPEERHKAVNREMTLLQFQGKNATPLGSINWFGVHATSLSNDNTLINADNKGYAATFLEEFYKNKNKNYVGAFAQGSAGDVTPKFKYNRNHHWQRGYWEGKYPDDIASARYNGELQFKKAQELIESTPQHEIKQSVIHAAIRYFDFSKIAIDTLYSQTHDIKWTSPSCIGLSMLGGVLMDGPGAAPAVLGLAKAGTQIVKGLELGKAKLFHNERAIAIQSKYKAQGNKNIVLETGAKRMMGTDNIKDVIIPGFTDPTVATFKRFHREGALKEHTWSPQILPVQLVQIGDIILAAFPFEITTTAGRRLKKGIEELYEKDQIKEVILCPYANSYSGYITTYEEYQAQMYEGGHTVFGAYSLAALQTVFKQLYQVRNKPFASELQPLLPPVFSTNELRKRSFYSRKKQKSKH